MNTSRQVDVKALVSHILRGDGTDKCRICMGDTTEGQVYLGDTVMLDGERPVTLAELLETITGIEVPMEDDLPGGVCSACSSSAIEAGLFRELCRTASVKWHTTLDLLNTLPFNNTAKSLQMYAILTDDEICILEEPYEEKPLTNKIKVKRDTRSEYVKSQHCQCPNCGKEFHYGHSLSQHLKESTDFTRACYICAEIMSRDYLVKHLMKFHKRQPYDCKKCPALFQSREQYKLHLAKAHAPGACTCGDCGRSFKSMHAYHAHLSIHAPKSCPGCDKLFRNQRCYLHHVKQCCNLDKNRKDTHQTKTRVTVMVKNEKNNRKIMVGMRGSADKECICDYCKKTFAGKKSVAAHIQIVHMKNTHRPCVYCGKSYAAAHMTVHMKKHESSDTFTCEYCGLVLKSRLGHSQHLRLHTGEKPYACKFCGETFSASSRRSEHIRKTHKSSEIVLKHGCELCPARFRLPYRLKKHMTSVHGDGDEPSLQFECMECHEKFSSCRGLLHHSRKHQQTVFPKIVERKIVLEQILG